MYRKTEQKYRKDKSENKDEKEIETKMLKEKNIFYRICIFEMPNTYLGWTVPGWRIAVNLEKCTPLW
jgi:hypothetical protein